MKQQRYQYTYIKWILTILQIKKNIIFHSLNNGHSVKQNSLKDYESLNHNLE